MTLKSTDTLHQDDALLASLDAFVTAPADGPLAGDNDLDREVAELFGLLSAELTPEAPRPELRSRVLARAVELRASAEPGHGAAILPFKKPEANVPPAAGAPFGMAGRGFVGALAMAAVLVFSLIGLGYLLGKTQEQQSTIARLEENLQASQGHLVEAELEKQTERLQMINAVARQFYPMQPVGEMSNVATQVGGRVWVCGQHQQWYLNLNGLEPPPPGQEYHLWFMTRDGAMVDAGAVELEGSIAELDAMSMPAGTSGFAVTLEQCEGDYTQPEGEMLLVGDHSLPL